MDDGQTTIETLFAQETPAPQQQEVAVQQPTEQIPDPAPVEVQAPVAPQEQRESQHVPLATLIETRRRAQAAEEREQRAQARADQAFEALQRLTQPQQPVAQPIDPNLDPAGAIQDLERRIAAELQTRDQKHAKAMLNQRLNMSEAEARRAHGAETVAKAFEAARESGYAPSFVNREDPYGEMVSWYQGQQVRQEVGSDLNAFRQRIAAEERAKIIAEMKGGATPQVPRNLPPSLSTATSANAQVPVVQDGGDFFKSMFSKQPRT